MHSVLDVRVKGAIGVVQVKKMHNLNWLRKRFVKEGVWIRPFLDVIYIMPAFTISDEELIKLIEAIIKIIPEWEYKV
jgi:adenosylmethionine-8-amino-7-oxononanoate aminotransferase